jgi:2-polyprenyl-3-methyl-5-hydroxy-6-metoxy-1,4-benzoquinol methylase
LPEATFIGIDLSSRQIARGQEMVNLLKLKNIDLRHANVLSVDASFGQFDYIICHGIYSWVPQHVREKILTICCRDNLAPQGVAYISYNTHSPDGT